eukprot:comp25597_c0_seq1/m.61616 comp25597_c0_seq1/g.61616  ORF comp25597_c0_seq1/g.61616 comp25597_c0_seq1/m.61616 type:complete len:186 (-) comp25597_c0_seq1:465-1022(-)
MSDCFLGEVRMFAGNYNPEDWILCNGQSLAVSQYQALFSLMGTAYGGDGVNTFNAPDLRGRVPVGQGTNTTTSPPLTPRTIGQKGGEEVHTVTVAEMPAHSHSFVVMNTTATSQSPVNQTFGKVVRNATVYGLYTDTPPTATTLVQFDAKAVTFAGGSQAHDNMMYTTAISFIMSVLGNYPTRAN